MGYTMNNKIQKKKLNIIQNSNGPIMHGLKKSDPSFEGFGEVYFSTVRYQSIKAWKRHLRMTLNLIVPIGTVKFVFYDEEKNIFEEHIIGRNDYFRITVLPKIWFGFKGLDKYENIVMNFANLEHDPKEHEIKDTNYLNYSW